MYEVELYGRVRRAVCVEGRSQRAVAREFGLSRETVRKMLRFAVPPGYQRQQPIRRPKLGPWLGVIDAILADDRLRPVKQRHTAKRIFERLKEEHGFTGGYTIVKDYVRTAMLRRQEMFVPLVHPAGEAQVDFGEALVVIAGVEQKAHYLAMDLPQSDDCFVAAFPAETTEAFLEGHVRAFAYFGGVPTRILLKELRLPTILREYDKVARQCAVEQLDYQHYLLRITELELLDRERRATERRIRQAKFPVVKTMDSFDFLAIPSLNKTLVLELARCEFLARRENVLLLGNSGTGKTHVALALGLAACQRGHRVRFTTTAALVSELIEARDEKKLLRFQKQIASYELLIVDELGFVPLSKTGAELLFEMLSQRYERGSTMVTSNLPFQEWTEVLGSERLTGALLDRLTHHVHILEMNGDSYRLKQSRRKRTPAAER
jgi:DNA replication protein DnaC/transposase